MRACKPGSTSCGIVLMIGNEPALTKNGLTGSTGAGVGPLPYWSLAGGALNGWASVLNTSNRSKYVNMIMPVQRFMETYSH